MVRVLLAATLLAWSAQVVKNSRDLIGRTTSVCGRVVTYELDKDEGAGCEVRLQIGRPYWEPAFYVAIADAARGHFPKPPEELYFAQEICVAGLVREAKRIPYILVEQPAQISVTKAVDLPPFGAGAHRRCEPGLTWPKLVKEVRPSYPSPRLVIEKKEDTLLLEAVVGVDGAVSDTRVLFSRVKEFEPAAIAAVQQWQFAPGKLNGEPVATIVQVEIAFTLYGERR